ncbi:AAA superfamily ATPase_gp183 [Bacillus phage vB_BceM_WH1]|nr:AAA superfamily ATPase_gp183 [Bacillus phage vB_BceM_WH1]
MKIINYGNTYEIYSDDLRTYDLLPAGTYKVAFDPMSGFSLVKVDNFVTLEEKIYGNHLEKIDKVLDSYDRFNRSLGVILSGDKGMGKSLFTQLLSQKAVEKELPVIMVTKAYPGVADFIDKIKQDALIMFDEFEKVFSISGGQGESQNNLLGLFDGTSQVKRLYAITVNNLRHVSEFMVSRTGRFHYHIRFDYPTASEIEIYLKDKIEEQYYGEIKHVVAFANKVKLNYDSLRAIAFELNGGISFRAAISDLNILATDTQRYDIKVLFSDGKTATMTGQHMNLFQEKIRIDGYKDGGDYFSITFEGNKIKSEMNRMFVVGDDISSECMDEDGDKVTQYEVQGVEITRQQERAVNYRLDY